MTGRRQDAIWKHFTRQKIENKLGYRAKCKKCGKEMSGLASRLKNHFKKCLQQSELSRSKSPNFATDTASDDSDNGGISGTSEDIHHTSRSEIFQSRTGTGQSSSSSISGIHIQKTTLKSIDSFITRTTLEENHKFDLQIAKFIYATNSPFRCVEHEEFKKMVNLLRPGYKCPNRRQVGNELLNETYESIKSDMEKSLNEKVVCLAMDGWSNIHNEPIVCVSATELIENKVYLIDTVDTQDNRHTTDYLLKLATHVIKTCRKFGCIVGSFVTDNAANMAKMREELAMQESLEPADILTYGCSAHILNLLAQDVDIPGVKSDVKKIIKYFRNTHFPAAKYKQAGGTALVLPQDVRWNTLCNSIESYLNNWHILSKVCSENIVAFDTQIVSKVNDIDLKLKAQAYQSKLKKKSVALDKSQKNDCTIGEVTEIWINLVNQFQELSVEDIQKCKKRMEMALTSAHYLANILDHRFRGASLTPAQMDMALQYASNYYEPAMSYIIKYQAGTFPFKDYLFSEEIKKNTKPVIWWQSLKPHLNDTMNKLATQLHTAVASSAGLERLFSNFGFVHSKIRNRLGIEKASKLVSVFKALNSSNLVEEELELNDLNA